MRAWIATALGVAVFVIGEAVDAGPRCVPGSSQPCLPAGKAVDFNSVPDIARQIASEEPIRQQRKNPAAEPAPAAPYTGPIFGVTSGTRTPTVGYSWSLE